MAGARQKKRPVVARVGRWAGRSLLALALALVVLPVLVVLALRIEWIASQVRERVLQAVNENLAGRIDAAQLDVALPWSLALTGVRILTPEGEPALTADRCEIELAARALLTGRVVVDRARILRPVVLLTDAMGRPTFARAFEPRQVPESTASSAGLSPVAVELRALEIRDGSVRFGVEPGAVAFEELQVDGSATLDDAARWHDVRVSATARGLPVTRITLATSGRFEPGELVVEAFSIAADEARLALHGSIDLTGPAFDVALDELTAAPTALGVPILGAVRVGGHVRGPLSDLVVALVLSTDGGELSLDARADLLAPEPTWSAALSSLHLTPGALSAAVPAGLEGALDLHAFGQGNPMATGFALLDARLDDLRLDDTPLGDVTLGAAARAGDLAADLQVEAADGATVHLAAQGALPPAAASARLDASDLDLEGWGARLGLEGLRGRIDTASVTLDARLAPGGVAFAQADVDLAARSVGVAPPLASEAEAAVHARGHVNWSGSGVPTGNLRLDVAGGSGAGATLRSGHIVVRVTRPRGTNDARLRADVTVAGATLPGAGTLRDATLALDVRGPANPPDWSQLRPAGSLVVSANGYAGPEASLQRLEARLDARPLGDDIGLRGPVTLKGLVVPGLLELDSAVARLDARVDPRKPDLTGEAGLAVAGLRAGAFELHTAAASISRDARGSSHVALRAERGPLRYEVALGIEGLDTSAARLETTLEALRVTDGATGVAATPGAAIGLAANGDVQVTGLALKGLGELVPSALEVDGAWSPGGGVIDGRVTLKGVDIERWLRFAERVTGSTLPSEVRGLVDGSVRVEGSASAPTITANLAVREGQVGSLHGAAATLDASLTAGHVTAKASATWAPAGRFSFQVDAPATVNLERDHVRLHLEPDAEVSVRAEATDLDLGLLGISVQEKPLVGTLTAALQLDGPLNRPSAVLGVRAKDLTLGGLDAVDVDSALVLQPEATSLRLQVARAGVIPIRVEADVPLNVATLASLSAPEALQRLTSTPFSVSLTLEEVRLGTIPFLSARFPELEETTVVGDARVSGTLAAPSVAGTLALRGLLLGDVMTNLDLSLATDGPLVKLEARVTEGDRALASVDLVVPDLVGLLSNPGLRTIVLTDGLRLDVEVPGLPLPRLAEISPGAGAWLTDLLGPGEVAASATLVAGKKGPTVVVRAVARGNNERGPAEPVPFAREVMLDATILPGDARVTLGFVQRGAANALTLEATAPLDLMGLLDGSGPPLDQVPLKATARTSAFDLQGLSSFLPQVFGSSSGRFEVVLDVTGTLAKPLVLGHAELRFDELTVAAAGLYQQGVVARIDVGPNQVRLQPIELHSANGAFELALTIAVPSFDPDDISLNGALRLDHFAILGRDDARAVMTGSVTMGGTLAAPVVAGDLTFNDAWFSPAAGGRTLQTVGLPDDVIFVTEDGLEEASVESGARLRRLAGALVLDVAVHLPPRHVRISNKMVDVIPTGDLSLRAKGGPLSIEGRISVVEGTVEFYGKRFTLSDDSLVVFPGGPTIDPRLDVTASYDISRVDLEPLGLTATADSTIRLTVTGTASKPKLELSSDPSMDQTAIISTMLVGSPIGSGQTRTQEAGVERQTMNLFVGLATGQLARLLTSDLPIDVFRVEAGEQGLATARITVGKRLSRDLTVIYEADLGAQPGENQNEVHVQYRLTRRLQLETYVGDAGRGGVDLLLRWRF